MNILNFNGVKIRVALFSAMLLIFATPLVYAEDAAPVADTSNSSAPIEAIIDETVEASDLEVSEPIVLPDNPFYFLKDWGRNIQSAFTFNKAKKAELKLRFANERLLEIKKLADTTGNEAILENAVAKYNTELEKTEALAKTLQNSGNPDTEKFLNKFTNFQIKRQKVIDQLATKLPEKAKERVIEAHEKSLKRFGEVLDKLDTPEKIKERLENAVEEQEGSQFKHFKNLEVLLKIQEKLPEKAQIAIDQAEENALKRLHGDLSNMSPEDQEKFKDYLSHIQGDEILQTKIMDRLEERGLPEDLREKIKESKEDVIHRLENRIENIKDEDVKEKLLKRMESGDPAHLEVLKYLQNKVAPETQDTIRKVLEKSEIRYEERQQIENRVMEKKERDETLCTQEFEPVCGANGKTYSNKCMARSAGVEIKHEGKCEAVSTETGAIKLPSTTLESSDINNTENRDYSEFKRKCTDLKGVILQTFPPQCRLSDGKIIKP